jgi:hypothetical protein
MQNALSCFEPIRLTSHRQSRARGLQPSVNGTMRAAIARSRTTCGWSLGATAPLPEACCSTCRYCWPALCSICSAEMTLVKPERLHSAIGSSVCARTRGTPPIPSTPAPSRAANPRRACSAQRQPWPCASGGSTIRASVLNGAVMARLDAGPSAVVPISLPTAMRALVASRQSLVFRTGRLAGIDFERSYRPPQPPQHPQRWQRRRGRHDEEVRPSDRLGEHTGQRPDPDASDRRKC